jgi:hypothetical protein
MEGRSLGDSRTGHHGGRYTLRSDGSRARAMHPGKPRIVRPDRRGVLEEGGRNYSLRRASVRWERNQRGRLGQRRHRLGDRMVAVFRGVLVEHRRVRASVPGAVH